MSLSKSKCWYSNNILHFKACCSIKAVEGINNKLECFKLSLICTSWWRLLSRALSIRVGFKVINALAYYTVAPFQTTKALWHWPTERTALKRPSTTSTTKRPTTAPPPPAWAAAATAKKWLPAENFRPEKIGIWTILFNQYHLSLDLCLQFQNCPILKSW